MFVIPGYYSMGPESLVSSSVSDNVAIWSSGTEYFQGDLVYASDGVTVYEAAVGPATFSVAQYCDREYGVNLPNQGFDPEENPTVPAMDRAAYPDYTDAADCYLESGRLWWIKRGEYWENKYRMFQESPELLTTGPASTGTSTIVATIRHTAAFQTISLVRVQATSVRFQSGAIDETFDLRVPVGDDLPGADLYDNLVADLPSEIPANQQFTLTVTHNNTLRRPVGVAALSAEVGLVYAGTRVELGMGLYGTQVGITDYSKKERDAFGRSKVLARAYTNRISYKISVDTDKIYAVRKFLSTLRATLSIYGIASRPETITAGYFKDFGIPIEAYSDSQFNLEVEGL